MKPNDGMSPEELAFEKMTDAEKAAAIAKHEEGLLWYGWCHSCKLKRVGRMKDINSPCPRCGFH